MVFISYCRKDKELVFPVVRIIKASGVEAFVDLDDIDYGEKWERKTMNAIRNSSRFMIFWSKHAANSISVKDEWREALKQRCKIIPVLLDRTPLPFELSGYHGTFELETLFKNVKMIRQLKYVSVVIIISLLSLSLFYPVYFDLQSVARAAETKRIDVNTHRFLLEQNQEIIA